MTRRPYIRRPYQALIAAHQLELARGSTFAGMGTGKTVETLHTLATRYLVDPAPALVVAPLRVAQSTWPDEAAKWDAFSGFDVVAAVGTPEQRRAALRRGAPVVTTNYENLPWLVEHLGDAWPFRTVVLDECTRLKSFRGSEQVSKTGKEFVRASGGVRARGLAKLAHSKVERWINLTGTPTPNGVIDLWAPLWFVDKGRRLGRTHGGFVQRWFRPAMSGYGVEPFDHSQAEITRLISDVSLSIEAKDWFDLREPIVNIIRVELPPKAREAYRAMEKEMFAKVDGHSLEAFGAASRTIKCLQMANGAAYTDDTATTWVEMHDAKLQALDSIVSEANGAPVLVAYHFKSDLARLRRAFPRGRHLDSDPQTIRDWNAGRIPVLFAHPESAGHGLNLQDGGNILVFFGHWWALEPYLQIIERIGPTRQAQAGHDRPVFIHHIVAADTVDELVMRRRETKRDVQDLLMEALKARQQ